MVKVSILSGVYLITCIRNHSHLDHSYMYHGWLPFTSWLKPSGSTLPLDGAEGQNLHLKIFFSFKEPLVFEHQVLRGMSLKFVDSMSTAQHKQLLVSSAISLYSVMYQKYMYETWWRYDKIRHVLYDAFTIGNMVSAGQVSVIITMSLFLYYTGS